MRISCSNICRTSFELAANRRSADLIRREDRRLTIGWSVASRMRARLSFATNVPRPSGSAISSFNAMATGIPIANHPACRGDGDRRDFTACLLRRTVPALAKSSQLEHDPEQREPLFPREIPARSAKGRPAPSILSRRCGTSIIFSAAPVARAFAARSRTGTLPPRSPACHKRATVMARLTWPSWRWPGCLDRCRRVTPKRRCWRASAAPLRWRHFLTSSFSAWPSCSCVRRKNTACPPRLPRRCQWGTSRRRRYRRIDVCAHWLCAAGAARPPFISRQRAPSLCGAPG
jgi:hypothetical protein